MDLKENQLERKRAGLSFITMVTFKAWAEIFCRNYFKQKSENYRKHSVQMINCVYAPWFSNQYLHEITQKDVQDFLDHRQEHGSSNKTRINDLVTLRIMFDKAIEHHYALENPCKGIETPKNIARKDRKPVPIEQFRALLRKADPELRNGILILINTGIRVGELFHLQGSDFDLMNGFMTIRSLEGRTTKNYRSRVVPIPSVVRTLVQGLEPEEKLMQVKFKTFEARFFRLRKELGMDWNMHELRHTYVSMMLKEGVDQRTVQEYVGHKTEDVTRRYSHFIPDRLQAKLNIGEEFLKEESDVVTIWSPAIKKPLNYKGFNVARDGIEPPTQGFSVLCSTD